MNLDSAQKKIMVTSEMILDSTQKNMVAWNFFFQFKIFL